MVPPTSNILFSTNWDGGIRCWEVVVQEHNKQIQPKEQANHLNSLPCTMLHVLLWWKDGYYRRNGCRPNMIFELATWYAEWHIASDWCMTLWFLVLAFWRQIIWLWLEASYDQKLKFWDTRSCNAVGTFDLPNGVSLSDRVRALNVIAFHSNVRSLQLWGLCDCGKW